MELLGSLVLKFSLSDVLGGEISMLCRTVAMNPKKYPLSDIPRDKRTVQSRLGARRLLTKTVRWECHVSP